MDTSSTYSSLLNSYLNESIASLPKEKNETNTDIPQINIIGTSGSQRLQAENSMPERPNSSISTTSSLSSAVSSLNSIYTSSIFSEDNDLQMIAEDMSPKNKPKRFFKKHDDIIFSKEEEQNYHCFIINYLKENYYNYSTSEVLNLKWDEIFEIHLFGNRLRDLFKCGNLQLSTHLESFETSAEKKLHDHYFNYLIHNNSEKGSLKFNLTKLNVLSNTKENIIIALDALLEDLESFENLISLYSNENNFGSSKLFEVFQNFIQSRSFPIPLALAMFGNYLLSFGGSFNNYSNDEIVSSFRISARAAWVLKTLNNNHYFDEAITNYVASDQIKLKDFLNKDNNIALSISLNNLAEFYQFHNDIDTAIDLWEVNSHLTNDSESCAMAIWGLSDGYGSGNKVKTFNKFGKKSKTSKFNTKRRIAQLYRIRGNDEVGNSWIFKKKYD